MIMQNKTVRNKYIQHSMFRMESYGSLFVVSTPIGNLEDITIRAINVLKEVDYILCEDTRVSLKLLNKYSIKTKLIAYHRNNEINQLENILLDLKSGKNIALISDAGTPLISDPGSILLSSISQNNLKAFSVPGPSALTAALSLCPFFKNEFLFVGFLPEQKSKRIDLISKMFARSVLVVLYIAPHDFRKYLIEIQSFYPSIKVFYAREITKAYEDVWYGEINRLIETLGQKKIKGEIVLCLDFKRDNIKQIDMTNTELFIAINDYINKGFSLKEASRQCSKEFGLSSKKLYKLYLEQKKSLIIPL